MRVFMDTHNARQDRALTEIFSVKQGCTARRNRKATQKQNKGLGGKKSGLPMPFVNFKKTMLDPLRENALYPAFRDYVLSNQDSILADGKPCLTKSLNTLLHWI